MLRSKKYSYIYSSGKNGRNPIDFFETALPESLNLDFGLGYFSSASFNVLATGFAHFISNGGTMRMFINPYITSDDSKIIQKSNSISEIEENFILSFSELKENFSKRDQHFFNCIAFLIKEKRIQIKFVIPNTGGLAHTKFGILTDIQGDKIAFTGSLNFTAYALLKNIETIDCFCSWSSIESKERVALCESDFEDIWNGKNDIVKVFDAQKFTSLIANEYNPGNDINDLIEKEDLLLKDSKFTPTHELPHFPNCYPSGPREYQQEAYKCWQKDNKKGIFAMATGTGKTVTALNCMLQECNEDYRQTNSIHYKTLILVPTLVLVEQWEDDVKNFGFDKVYIVCSSNDSWKKDLVTIKNDMKFGRDHNFVIISTYLSFISEDFQQILNSINHNLLLIADEVHNIGSKSVLKVFKTLSFEKMIALSATPERYYDDEGTAEISRLFFSKPPYTYSISLAKAIENNFLVRYAYYPKIVNLDQQEMDEYISITKSLCKYINQEGDGFTNELKAKKLLMLRKRIIHKANGKISALKEIIQELGPNKTKYCFVYVPEGSEITDENNKNDDDDSVRLINKMVNAIKEVNSSIRCNTYIGKKNKHERKAILNSFEQGKIDVLLAMKCLDEGVDVPRAEYGIFCSSTGNPRQYIQRRGRLLRKHEAKTFATIYDMIVVPIFCAKSSKEYKVEKNIVLQELRRVAHFAALSDNIMYSINTLNDIANHYEINLSKMMMDIKNNN